MHDATNLVHSPIPPCSCHACLRAIHLADQRRAEIAAILRRLDELELRVTTADRMEKEAE